MKLKFYLVSAFIISVICIIGFSVVSFLISDHEIAHFDSTIISAVQGLESPGLTKMMKTFTFIGSASFVSIMSLLLIFFLYKVLHHRTELILFVFAIGGSAILNEILKHFFQRARPDFHRLIDISGFSFPSGHAMNAFTVYVIITFLLWRHISRKWARCLLILISTVMILAIGVSRIYLGVHYPSDVLGGYLASGFWCTMAIWFFQYYKEKGYNIKYNR
ncbi:phosphatase PAP2 family protein [Bacillus sp. JJ1764]|uniref:phosphatase PAP2 family protein n=1 Tax=Bacillus sp. JJ1764 TaxID=3122964 RepID=UPI002FFF48D3